MATPVRPGPTSTSRVGRGRRHGPVSCSRDAPATVRPWLPGACSPARQRPADHRAPCNAGAPSRYACQPSTSRRTAPEHWRRRATYRRVRRKRREPSREQRRPPTTRAPSQTARVSEATRQTRRSLPTLGAASARVNACCLGSGAARSNRTTPGPQRYSRKPFVRLTRRTGCRHGHGACLDTEQTGSRPSVAGLPECHRQERFRFMFRLFSLVCLAAAASLLVGASALAGAVQRAPFDVLALEP
jgi:hypothetical protein